MTGAHGVAARADDRLVLVTSAGGFTIGALAHRGRQLREVYSRGSTVVLVAPTAVEVAEAILGLDGWAGCVVLSGDAVASDPGGPPSGGWGAGTGWRVFSSGTTGPASGTVHNLAGLTRFSRTGAGEAPRRWGLLYPAWSMAGLQVLLRALRGIDIVIEAEPGSRPAHQLRFFAAESVDALSATPTRWRSLLGQPAVEAIAAAQVTLGGETADQRVLDALSRQFPGARVSHAYASSEAGPAFVVHDGKAGFPAAWLDDPGRSVPLSVRDGVLHVRASGSAAAGADGYVRTGDLVSVVDDRVYFAGRESGLINVGGAKVAPAEVETVLLEAPEVQSVVVVGRRSSVSGWTVLARVVLTPRARTRPWAVVEGELRALVASRLPRACVPATFDVVEDLQVSQTGKLVRR